MEGDALEFTRRAVVQREIWFSSVCDFNDPFEARVTISMDAPDARWMEDFGRPKPDPVNLAAMIKNLENGVREDAAKLGMFCLSCKSDDILMWSHYSAKHRGVCLGFSATGGSIFADGQPVTYSPGYPAFNYFETTAEQRARLILLTKARAWAHEEEWRVFRNAGAGLERYPHGMVARIILGCEVRPADRDEVIGWTAKCGSAVRLFQAHRNPGSFALVLEDLHGGKGAV